MSMVQKSGVVVGMSVISESFPSLFHTIHVSVLPTYNHQPPLQDTVRMPKVHLGKSHRVGLKKIHMDQKTGNFSVEKMRHVV